MTNRFKTGRFQHPNPKVQPDWFTDIPYCSISCPLNDGKRCGESGHKLPRLCLPMVKVIGGEPKDNDPCRACGSMSFTIYGRRLRRALLDVGHERGKQDDKWGDTLHSPELFYAILGEEVGELGTAVLNHAKGAEDLGNMREEAVQVAAVAVRMIELIDRRIGGWPGGSAGLGNA